MIHRLSEEVRAALRTGVALTSFAQAVEELVLNSIDAGATSVAVRVDLQSFKIQIVDNGSGITQEQFPLIGERYATSKCNSLKDLDNLKYFGYRGEALASLRSAATFLEIISRPRSSGITYCKCFHNGKPSDTMESSAPRPSAGTTVTAHNLYYNLPVRQKHLNEVLEMERIRFHVAATALMWPHISFSLRDDSVGHVILQTCKSNSVPMSLSAIFPAAKSRNLKELSISEGEFKIYGVVCTDSYSRKDLQFVFVNKRLVLKSSIHHQMNKILGRSLILRKKCISWEEKLSSGFVNSSSPVKQAERYGIFVINVECPYSAYDITFEPRKTLVEFKNWPKLIHLIQDLIYGFLRKENLLSLTDPPPTKGGRGNEKDEERYQSDGDNESEREELEDGKFSKNNNFNESDNKSINCTDTSPVSGATFLLTDVPNALFSKTVCRPKIPKDCLDPNSSMPVVANQNVTANVDICLGASQKGKGNYLFRLSNEELLPGQSHTERNNLHNGEIDSEKQNGRSECEAHKTAHNIRLNALQRGSRNLTTFQRRTKRHQGANGIGDQTDISEIPFALPGLNQVNDSEDIYARKQKGDHVREITLGKSVHYHSTLKRLRDSDEKALGKAKAGEIITNTLQQLRQSAQEAVKSLGDLYKTPVVQKMDLEDELHRKQPRMEVKINQANTNTNISRYETADTITRHCDDSVSIHSSQEGNRLRGSKQFQSLGHRDRVIGLSFRVLDHCDKGIGLSDRGMGHSDRGIDHSDRGIDHQYREIVDSDRGISHSDKGIGQKRSLKQSVSQATKLSKLRKGEKVTGDLHLDEPDTRSSKRCALLKTFTYRKQKQDDDFSQTQLETRPDSSYVTDAHLVYVKYTHSLSELSAKSNKRQSIVSTASSNDKHPPISTASSNDKHPPISTASSYERHPPISTVSSNERYSPLSTASRSSLGKNTSDDWTSLKQIPNENLNKGTPSCQDSCCCKTGTKDYEEKKCLPFSMYHNCKHKTQLDEVGTPRVSVVLSLPIEGVRSETIKPTSQASLSLSKCPTTTPCPTSVLYTPQGISISMPQISFRNAPESLNQSCDLKSVSNPCPGVNKVVQLSQGFAVKNVCSNSRQADAVSDSQGFHLGNHQLVDDSIDSLKDTEPDLVATGILNTPTMSYSYQGEGSENVLSHSGFTSGGFSVKLSSSAQEKSESTPANTSDNIRDEMNPSEEINELPCPVMGQNANGLPIEISCVDDTHQMVDSTSIPVTLVCSASQKLTCTIGQSLNCAFSQSVDSTHDQSNAQRSNEQCQDFEYIVGDQLGTDIIPKDPNSETSHTPLQTSSITSSLPELEQFSFSSNELTSNQCTQSCLVSKNENAVMEISQKIQKPSQLVGKVQRLRPEVRNSELMTENCSHNLVDPKLSEYHFVTCKPRISPISRLLNSGNSSYECSTTAEPTSTYFLDKCKSVHGDAVGNDIHRAASISPLQAVIQSPLAQSIAVVKQSLCQNTGTGTHLNLECDKDADQDDDSKHSDLHCSFEELNNVCCAASSKTMSSDACSNDSVPCAQEHQSSAISLSDSSGGSISIFDYITEERDRPLNTGQVQAADVGVNTSPNVYQQVNYGSEPLFGNAENLKTQTNILSSNNVVSISENESVSAATISNSKIHNDGELTHFTQTQSRKRNPLPGTALPDSSIAGSQVNDLSPPPLVQKNSVGLQTNLMCLEVTGSHHESDDHIENSHCKEHVSQPERLDPPAVSHAHHISHVSVMGAINHRDQLQTTLEKVGSENRCTPLARIAIVSVSRALDLVDHKPQPLRALREHCQASFTKREHSDAQTPTEVVPLGPGLVQNLNTHCNTPVQSLTSSPSQIHHGTWSSDQASCDSELMETNGIMRWQEVSDSITGRRLYINNESGHTLSEDQWTEISATEPVLDKSGAAVPTLPDAAVPGTVPESLSAQLTDSQRLSLHDMVNSYKEQENCDTLSKWRGGERPVYEKEVGADISTLMSKWTNPVFLSYKQPSVNAEICPTGQTARSCFNSLSLVEFTKDMLTDVKVIGQIDCKFIACLIQKSQIRSKATNCHQSLLLVLFDQHAVHERIRLEQFTCETYEVVDGVRSDKIKRSDLSPPHRLTMDLEDLRVMNAFSKEFNRIGITFVRDRTCRNVVHISSAPVCITHKDAADTKRKAQSLPEKIELLIKEHIQLIKSTNGACCRMPLTIHKLLCSQACHGAVKFGDKLTLGECQDLLSALKLCDLPFQCAHGRPSVAPLVDVTALEKELSEERGFPRLSKISANIYH